MNETGPVNGESIRAFAYHEIRNVSLKDVYSLTPEVFMQHVWTMREAAGASKQNLVISFDDGHQSHLRWASPILELLKLRGHFFIPTTWIGNRAEFMDWRQVRQLAADGHVIGSHSATHTFLPHCTKAHLQEELHGSRQALEDQLGAGITSISMPGGRWDHEVLRACAVAGYKTVYTSEPGYHRPSVQENDLTLPEVIGRFAVQRRTYLKTITRYAAGNPVTVRRLQGLYQIRGAAKQILGDRGYQKLWSHLFRAVPG